MHRIPTRPAPPGPERSSPARHREEDRQEGGDRTLAEESVTIGRLGKEAIAGGVRLEGELKEVAVTGSYPFSSGSSRTGWTGIAHESGAGPYGDWSVVAFVVCAEL